jgi:hypothetical protein
VIFLYKIGISLRRVIMRWEEEYTMEKHLPSWMCAQEIVYNVYREGFINWNIYDKAMQMISTTKNGSWMFEQKQ